jgi:hypothetical protein
MIKLKKSESFQMQVFPAVKVIHSDENSFGFGMHGYYHPVDGDLTILRMAALKSI